MNHSPQSDVGAALDRMASLMAAGQTDQALKYLQTAYPVPRGWVPSIAINAARAWSVTTRAVQTHRNGHLYCGGRDWFTQTRDGLHIADQVNANPAGGQYVLRQTATHTAMVAPRPRQILTQEPAILIGSNRNYCHWLLDFSPRLPLALELDKGLKLIVGDQLAGYEKQTLAQFGIEAERLCGVPGNTVTRFRRLLVPDLGTIDRIPHVHTIEWLRSTFLTATGSRRRIWISRQDAAMRRVVNEAEVMEALRPHGFEAVTLEGLSIADQAALFAGAEMIAGPHGAAFANAVFCRPGTAIFEAVPGDYRPLFFGKLANACTLRYGFLACPTRPTPEQMARLHPRNWDMAVNVAALVAALKA